MVVVLLMGALLVMVMGAIAAGATDFAMVPSESGASEAAATAFIAPALDAGATAFISVAWETFTMESDKDENG